MLKRKAKEHRVIHALNIGVAAAIGAGALAGCRTDEVTVPSEEETVGPSSPGIMGDIKGFYLVNEGNMGSNKCTLDYFDYATGVYTRNIYAERNPGVVMELGDVGNDAGIYGSRLYVVVNCSHKVEVLDAESGVRIGQVDIPNCRYVCFHGGKAYVSSYVGPVQTGPQAPKGAVYEVDTLSLNITRQVTVGYQPEEMVIAGEEMYVANSGGYRAPDYDHTISVIDMKSFRQVRQIETGPNLHRLRADSRGQLWANSRGEGTEGAPSCLYTLAVTPEHNRMEPTDTIEVECTNFAIFNDRLYYFGTSQGHEATYGIIDTDTHEVIAHSFITDGTEKSIRMPYLLAVHPENGDIYVSDARNYVSSGTLYCFSPEGKLRWSVRTGDIPAAMAWRRR